MPFDQTDAADLAALKSEVETDPAGIGYAATAGDTAALLALLNLAENNPGAQTVGIPFDELALWEVIDDVDAAEYEALTGWNKTRVDIFLQAAASDPELMSAHARKAIRQSFGATSATWVAIKDDRQRPASRAEVLFGRDTIITRDDWTTARDS